jgi:hypothetical protein
MKHFLQLTACMRKKISRHRDIIKRIMRLDMGWFDAGKDILEMTSRINDQQGVDKMERAYRNDNPHDAGLDIMFEAWCDFFTFSPFFYMKNMDRNAGGKAIRELPFEEAIECWDEDAKSLWKKTARIDSRTAANLRRLRKLNFEILGAC